MKKKVIGFSMCAVLVLFVMATPGLAAPTCASVTPVSYATLMALGAGGCTINDLLFSNFTFAASSTGSGSTPVASQVSYVVDNPGLSLGSGQTIWGFEFNPNLSVSNIGSEDIQINYQITAPINEITSIHLLESGYVVNGAGSTATVGESDCVATLAQGLAGCTTLSPSLQVNSSSTTAAHMDALGIGPYAYVVVHKDINVNSSATGGVAVQSIVRDAVDESAVPEPATVSYMLGGGLLLLGAALRRKR